MNADVRKHLAGAVLTTVMLPLALVAGERDSPLTTEKVDAVWNDHYEYPSCKWKAFKNVIEEVGNYAACSTGQTVVALEELVLSKVLTMRVGTLEDRQEGAESRCEITGVAIYLVAISRWPSMRKDRDRFLRVADGLARYSLLPDLSKTDAKRLADRIDDYLKYGTNKPPFKAGVARKWNGPVSEHVYKTAHFRELYNSSVMEMRRRVIGVYERVIFEDGFRQISEIDRQNLWKEFLVRAGEKVD